MYSKDNVEKLHNDIKTYSSTEYSSSYLNTEQGLNFSNGPKDKRKIKKKKDFGNMIKNLRRKYFSKRYSPKRRKPTKITNRTPLAIKTNLTYSAALTPNLGVEVPIKKNFSAELTSTYNAWDLEDNVKWKNLTAMAEFRYWPKKSMEGAFFGLNANWAKYNIGGIKMPYFADAKYYRYDGWTTGIGLSYGYMWYLSRSWSFEANIGIGLNYTSYDKYLHPVCGAYWGSYKNILFMPTKIGLSLVYKFN
ncbi:MAG: DUF3575 domain-containing protein [Bacteroidales bacterium]